MKRSVQLITLGLLPFVAGDVLLFLKYHIPGLETGALAVLPYLLLQFLWGLLAYRLCRKGDSAVKNALLLHVPALFVLFLLLYQDLILGRYWLNIAGTYTQIFYLPFLRPVGTVVTYVMMQFTTTLTQWPLFPAAFVTMFVISFLGGLFKRKKCL